MRKKKSSRRTIRGGLEIEDLGYVELPPGLDREIQKRIAQADDDLLPASVNFRWYKGHLAVVKHVARVMGVSYQTYIKMIVYKQALIDLQAMTGQSPPPVKISKAAAKKRRVRP